MPAQVADWSQVRATAIACGNLLDAAEHHGLKYEAVRQRASREKWPVGRRVHQQLEAAKAAVAQQIVTVTNGSVTPVTSADAIQKALSDGARNTRVGLTRYAERMAKQAADSGILEEAPLYKAVADIHAKMHPETQGEPALALGFFIVPGNTEVAPDETLPATIDVDAEQVTDSQ